MNQTYNTRSLYVAAALIAAGVPYRGLQDGPSGKALFRFDNADDAAWQYAQRYNDRSMNPAPQPASVIDALFRLRDEIRQHVGR